MKKYIISVIGMCVMSTILMLANKFTQFSFTLEQIFITSFFAYCYLRIEYGLLDVWEKIK